MNITIQKFQELYLISMYETSEMEKSSLLVQCLTGKNEDEVNKMNIKRFNKLCKRINDSFDKFGKNMNEKKPKNIVMVGKKFYWLNYDIAKPPMNAGRYVEIATYSEDIIGNLHKIMATMSTPMKLTWKGLVKIDDDKVIHSDVANDMLKMDFGDAYHSGVFFYAVFTKSIQNLSTYFKSITTEQMQVEQVLKNLQEVSDGYTMARWYQNLKI